MKPLIIVLSLFISTITIAQDNYTNTMQKAFQLWGEGKPTDASNLFEGIATVEADNWLPYYYVAQINTIISFGEKDKEKLTKQLEKAQEYIYKSFGIINR